MSELSYLEKLLDGAGVEWITLEKLIKRAAAKTECNT